MRRHPVPSATHGLIVGLDLLLATLVVVAVVQAPPETALSALLVGGVLLAIYVWGRAVVRTHEGLVDIPRGAWWPDAAWIGALMVSWVLLLGLSPAALWIAFPFMLLQMHVLGPHRGVLLVALTTVVTVADGLLTQAGTGERWTGYVLGPVLGAGVAVAVVLGIEAFLRESQDRQRTVDELTQARLHLAQAERERAVTDERARLARDIHDTLAQSLSAIELLLRAAEDAVGVDEPKAHELLGQARSAARDSLAEARRVVQDLTPADLERTTLLGAVRRVADRLSGPRPGNDRPSAPLAITVHTSGTPRPLPVPLETALLRIAQSALANVAEHAAAARARVTLTYEADSITLDVVDDGTGFDPAAPGTGRTGGRGFGIPAIRSRVQELGGTFALETSLGGGTALAVTLPVRAEDER
ncbi:sensor histidine kinase [Myceligenerans sp. I2]|uniref:Oxygen sensor histidine kinase NreB n=1 Tax=Myceligenerans indicum TaxID=2593663 RepID=A0ABS1LIN8_9MICO|nr:sensor histidine kinase [Myceligenerans indicum]